MLFYHFVHVVGGTSIFIFLFFYFLARAAGVIAVFRNYHHHHHLRTVNYSHVAAHNRHSSIHKRYMFAADINLIRSRQ